MVGRELPNMCPNGEDHRGVGGRVGRLKRGYTTIGQRGKELWRSWTARIRIHKVPIWQELAKNDSLVTRFSLQVLNCAGMGVNVEYMHTARRASPQKRIRRQAQGRKQSLSRIPLLGN